MAKRLILILSLLAYFTECLPQDVQKDNLLREIVIESGQARVIIPFPGARVINELSRFVSVSSVRNNNVEIVLSPRTVDWFILQRYDYKIPGKTDNKGITMAADVKQASDWETYPSYTQYVSIMQDFPVAYPGLCKLDTIGTSNYGKLVLALKISDNAGTDEDEPETFYTSAIHGDETGGFVLMLRLADHLLKNYSTDARTKNLVDNLEIWINPLANPDGTYRTGDIITSPVRDNANGYDLNRNFPDPDTPNTIKQKETIDMIQFMREHRFKLSANFHSGAEVVNYPWDRWWRWHADNNWFYNISRKYADTAHLYSVSGYMTFLGNGVTNGFDWYSINGGRQDFVTYELQGREVTIEIDDDYITPAADLSFLWQYNWRSLIGYLENALYGIQGSVTDVTNGNPVAARIKIQDHDKDSSHVYSDPLTGSFVRYLEPGAWDLVVTASKYVDVHMENVIVTEDQKTIVDIQMTPYVNPIDTTDTSEIILYPNPVRANLNAVMPARLFGMVNVKVYNMLGVKLKDYDDEAVEDIPLRIDVTDLAGGVYVLIISNSDDGVTDRKRFVVVEP